jgi:predicted dehydrogenase
MDAVDAVYICTASDYLLVHTLEALKKGKHVLCDALTSTEIEVDTLYNLAKNNGLVLLQCIGVAFLPAFQRMVAVALNARIGQILGVTASYVQPERSRGHRECAAVPLLAITKLLGAQQVQSVSTRISEIRNERYSEVRLVNIDIGFEESTASVEVSAKALSQNDLTVTGTRGCVYVPSPWWECTSFEMRFEDPTENQMYSIPKKGHSIRYALAEFINVIQKGEGESCHLSAKDAIVMWKILSQMNWWK